MRKKAIAYEFLVRLLIAVIALAFVVSIASRCFRITDEAEESFNRLADKIEEAQKWKQGESDSVRLDMDEGTFVLFFSHLHPRIQMSSNRGSVFFERPAICGENVGCVCLCRDHSAEYFDDHNSVFCENMRCREVGELNFQRPKIPNAQVMDFQGTYEWFFIGGAMIQRDFITLLSDDFKEEILEQQRIQAIYIEKGQGNLVGICRERGKCLNSNG